MILEYLELIIFFAIFVVGASNVLKALIKIKFKEAKVGLLIAVIMGIALSVGFGKGMINMLYGIEYNNAGFPILFKSCDLIFSGLLYSLGSKIVTDVFGKLVVSVKSALELYAESVRINK